MNQANICDTRDAARRIIGEARIMSGSYSERALVLDALQEALAEALNAAGLTVEQVEVLERRAVGVLFKLDVKD